MWTFNVLVTRWSQACTTPGAPRSRDATRAGALDASSDSCKPHFLFNTLHTISAFVLEDPKQANRNDYRLSELLRQSFNRERGPLVTLEEESSCSIIMSRFRKRDSEIACA